MDTRIKEALSAESNGKLVVIPTETVYGLSAPINDEEKIKKIFALKERPFFDPLIVHVENIEEARAITSYFPLSAQTLAKKFWPGPLTLVLPKASHVSEFITSGLPTVGVRIPKNQVTLDYIKALGSPIAAPSANKFGKTSPTCKEHVEREFDPTTIFILDDGPSSVGIESTIVKIEALENGAEQVTVLRPGIISLEEVKNSLSHLSSKGQLSSRPLVH
jgi:L-threonylcarbamoyladenylate synthase